VVVFRREDTLDARIAGTAIKACLTEIRARLNSATRTAKSAEVCAHAGSPAEAVQVALEVKQLTCDATRLLDTARLINRLGKE
jgi:hypothetical protein